MKQLATQSNSKATINENNMLSDYWEVTNKNGIETFVFSDNEFLKKYSSKNYFSSLKSLETFAVYNVEECCVCLESFNVIINDRIHLKSYAQSKNKCCRVCGHFQSSIEKSIITNI